MTTTNKRTPIPMPDDMRSALQRVADADGRSMAYVAREAIAALLDGREPGWRAGREPVWAEGPWRSVDEPACAYAYDLGCSAEDIVTVRLYRSGGEE